MESLRPILDILCVNQIGLFGGSYTPLERYQVEKHRVWTTTYGKYAATEQLFMVSIYPHDQAGSVDKLAYKVQVKYYDLFKVEVVVSIQDLLNFLIHARLAIDFDYRMSLTYTTE